MPRIPTAEIAEAQAELEQHCIEPGYIHVNPNDADQLIDDCCGGDETPEGIFIMGMRLDRSKRIKPGDFFLACHPA